MFNGSSVFMRFGGPGSRMGGGLWWMLMAPGLGLILFALAILIWPELLAYMVASALLMAGIFMVSWAWAMRRASRQMKNSGSSVFAPQDGSWRVQP